MQNNFAALNSAQEPAQMIAQATSAAKNRRKKEKAKAKKAAANNAQQDAPAPSKPSVPTKNGSSASAAEAAPQKAPAPADSLEQLQHLLNTESANLDCWGVWDEWARRVASENGDRKYKDRGGRRFTFCEALVSSGAIARSVANCARISMMPADKTQLEALLKACYADSAESSKNISHVAYEVSQAMQGAPHETQAAAAGVLSSIITRFQQATESASDSMPGTDLSQIEGEILRHMPVLHRAISQPDTVKADTINAGMHVAQLLREKYEAEKHLSAGQVPSICLAAKSDAQQLASILAMHARTRAADTGGAGHRDDSMVAALAARISALEAELTVCRADLEDAIAAQGTPENGHSTTATAVSAQHIVDRVEAAVSAAAHMPVGQAGNADDTLMQLMEHCRNCAQMQDKLMERLSRELDFGRTRLLNASKMKSDSGVAAARELLSGVRSTSSEIHDAAARLEALVAALDAHVGSSPAYSALRPMSMQVKHIAAQVYSTHNHLTARAWPDAILEEAMPQNGKRGGGRNISMDEILRMNVGGKGGKGDAGAVAPDPASQAATQGSTGSTAGPPAESRSPPSSQVGQPHSAKGMPIPPPGYAPPPGMVPMQQGYGQIPGAPMGGMVAHSMHVQPPGVVPVQQVVPVAPVPAGPPATQGVPVQQAPPSAAVARFGSSLAVAEEAAANLSKLLPPARPPPVGGRTGGRAGVRGRGSRRV